MLYAQVIVDISQEALDHTFSYIVPEEMTGAVFIGAVVRIPFGRGDRERKGYVVDLSDTCTLPPQMLKEIREVCTRESTGDGRLIALAAWMKETYGSTMFQALRTVLPVREKVETRQARILVRLADPQVITEQLEKYSSSRYRARTRILQALLTQESIPWAAASRELGMTPGVLTYLTENGLAEVRTEISQGLIDYGGQETKKNTAPELTENQRAALNQILEEFAVTDPRGLRRPVLLQGVTGSGKTLIYMEVIERVLAAGRQVIVLIPEIALTYQTVNRFYARFGSRVSVLNSRMSRGERYEQLRRARDGESSVMVGPRSALFTPFPDLGLIIIDEEHETTYKSEQSPRYHARETAVQRALMEDARVLLGSATPSLEAYSRAMEGTYRLVRMDARYGVFTLPPVKIVDMRQEFRKGNRSILSRTLQQELADCLEHGNQAMLFLNRRGYAAFVSCRNCGEVIKCPHCDVALSEHNNGRMICHYCGYETPRLTVCPVCGSPHIGGFKAGTQQVEKTVRDLLPQSRILRMDYDTTRTKGSYEKILSSFARHEADILIGTQMIVKGHDFPDVTLVGALAADLSLGSDGFRGAERTYQLLAQAAGRAGRGSKEGKALFQTYHPEHYSIRAAARQDYEAFYNEEMSFRSLMDYPPAAHLMAVLGSCADQDQLTLAMNCLRMFIGKLHPPASLHVIGPAPAAVEKVRDVYYRVLYLKHAQASALDAVRERLDRYIAMNEGFEDITIQYDMQ